MRARRQARVLVLHGLYQIDVAHSDLNEVVETIRREAEESGSLNFVEEGNRAQVLDFFELLLRGVSKEREELDRQLVDLAHNWSWDRIARVEKNLLRMGAYELLHRPDIPARATINEALELARDYGDDKSGAFVNALLDSLRKKVGVEID